MTDKKNANFIESLPESYQTDAYYKLYKQAEAAERALAEAIVNDWESANKDKVSVVINGTAYDISIFSAEAVGSLGEFLRDIKRGAEDELKYSAELLGNIK